MKRAATCRAVESSRASARVVTLTETFTAGAPGFDKLFSITTFPVAARPMRSSSASLRSCDGWQQQWSALRFAVPIATMQWMHRTVPFIRTGVLYQHTLFFTAFQELNLKKMDASGNSFWEKNDYPEQMMRLRDGFPVENVNKSAHPQGGVWIRWGWERDAGGGGGAVNPRNGQRDAATQVRSK